MALLRLLLVGCGGWLQAIRAQLDAVADARREERLRELRLGLLALREVVVEHRQRHVPQRARTSELRLGDQLLRLGLLQGLDLYAAHRDTAWGRPPILY